MEKKDTGQPSPRVRETSEQSSVRETSEDHETDLEARPELNRVVSGPPYTIFSPRAKMFIVLAVSVSGLISPLGAVTFYPALNILAKQLDVTPSMINIALTTYMVPVLIFSCSVYAMCAERLIDRTSHRPFDHRWYVG